MRGLFSTHFLWDLECLDTVGPVYFGRRSLFARWRQKQWAGLQERKVWREILLRVGWNVEEILGVIRNDMKDEIVAD